MIKANELRIGNYIKVRNNFTQVTSLELCQGDMFIYFAGGDDNLTIEGIEPIPLTEELLLKCGFNKWRFCEDCAYIKCNGQYLFIRKWYNKWIAYFTTISKEGTAQAIKGFTQYPLYRCPQYLHKLQNLYFDLEETELEIKL